MAQMLANQLEHISVLTADDSPEILSKPILCRFGSAEYLNPRCKAIEMFDLHFGQFLFTK